MVEHAIGQYRYESFLHDFNARAVAFGAFEECATNANVADDF
jgi:hypothetical protein